MAPAIDALKQSAANPDFRAWKDRQVLFELADLYLPQQRLIPEGVVLEIRMPGE